jgi:hypothetical protein
VDLKWYFLEVFPSLWGDMENLISEGRLIAPREVLAELMQYGDKEDTLLRWAKAHRRMFVDLDEEQQQMVLTVNRDFPNLVDRDKTTEDADPFLVALAKSRGCGVVTQERPTVPPKRPRIPNVCEKYEVKCVSLKDFFMEQGWKY